MQEYLVSLDTHLGQGRISQFYLDEKGKNSDLLARGYALMWHGILVYVPFPPLLKAVACAMIPLTDTAQLATFRSARVFTGIVVICVVSNVLAVEQMEVTWTTKCLVSDGDTDHTAMKNQEKNIFCLTHCVQIRVLQCQPDRHVVFPARHFRHQR